MSTYAGLAQEFLALTSRAARQGRLDPYELMDSYLELAPSSHPELKNSRKLDLQLLVSVLSALPQAFAQAPKVMVVPRLQGFRCEPVPSPGPAAGQLEDGTLLLEARYGLSSLLGLAASLCALTHELDKARALVPPAEDEFADADATPEEEDTQAGCGAAEPERAPLAFSLGVDEQALESADTATQGLVSALLAPAFELPEIVLHADLAAGATHGRVRAHAQHIVDTLAEIGLAARPLHLWLGPNVITDCLSPYTRDLREPMLQWARMHRDKLGEDIDLDSGTLGEDATYALAHDFIAATPGLADERANADRSVGILRHHFDGLPFEIIDLGRVDLAHADARLPRFSPPSLAPVLLRVALDPEDDAGELIAGLVEPLQASLVSLSLVLEGAVLNHPAGTVALPDVLVAWASEPKIAIPAGARWQGEALNGLSEAVIEGGAVVSVPHANLLSMARVGELARRYQVHAIEVAHAGSVAALADAVWAGQLGPQIELGWAVVGTHYARTRRPSIATITGTTALAISRLRRIMAAGRTDERSKGRRDKPPPASGRAMRIKA